MNRIRENINKIARLLSVKQSVNCTYRRYRRWAEHVQFVYGTHSDTANERTHRDSLDKSLCNRAKSGFPMPLGKTLCACVCDIFTTNSENFNFFLYPYITIVNTHAHAHNNNILSPAKQTVTYTHFHINFGVVHTHRAVFFSFFLCARAFVCPLVWLQRTEPTKRERCDPVW